MPVRKFHSVDEMPSQLHAEPVPGALKAAIVWSGRVRRLWQWRLVPGVRKFRSHEERCGAHDEAVKGPRSAP